MKTLDRYIARSFLTGYLIAFGVLLGLRIIIDLFVNLDEFTEDAGVGTLGVISNVITFYGLNCTLYFRDFAGMITVLAAVFSLGKMVRSNEFVAMMASGVSLKRVIAPAIVLAIALTSLLVIDQELVVPRLSDKLVRRHDEAGGARAVPVRGITDSAGSLIFAQKFDPRSQTLYHPTILTRQWLDDLAIWDTTGFISAETATYNSRTQAWDLAGGTIVKKQGDAPPAPIKTYRTDLRPSDILIRRKTEYMTLLSWSQLAELQAQGEKIRDLPQLYSQKHFRVTEPIMNIVMLLVCLPVLVCRDPKAMKSAVATSFVLTGMCMVVIFVAKMLATEAVWGRVELWAWLPIFVFLPTALFELDSMKT